MTLDELALQAQTDKASNGHNYTPVYASYLEHLRTREHFTIFELGVGGYQYPDRGGQSLKMWYNYFPNAMVVGIDFYEKVGMANDRTFVLKGSQDDPEFMQGLVNRFGQPDLIVDDASHISGLTIKSFEILFPHLVSGGLYFCEDVHTSFWPDYGGEPDPHGDKLTTLRFFQRLTPQLSQDSMDKLFHNDFTGYLDFIHFYRNLVIIKKK